MDDTERMIALLRRLKVEMNGAVVGAMQERGISYPLSYGVSVSTIREIASECPPSHSLALLLFRQEVRELKLSAVYVDRPEWVTRDQMQAWSRSFTHTEIVEQVASGLFWAAPDACLQAIEWMAKEDPWLHYAALLMGGKCLLNPSEDNRVHAPFLLEAADNWLRTLTEDISLPGYMIRAGVTLLRRCAALSTDMKRKIQHLNAMYAGSSVPALQALSEELGWQLEYLD